MPEVKLGPCQSGVCACCDCGHVNVYVRVEVTQKARFTASTVL